MFKKLMCIIIQKAYPLQLFKFMMITLDINLKIVNGYLVFKIFLEFVDKNICHYSMLNSSLFAWSFAMCFLLVRQFSLIAINHDAGLSHYRLATLLWLLKLAISHLFSLIHTYSSAIKKSSVKSLALL